jgi:hypothetical protein
LVGERGRKLKYARSGFTTRQLVQSFTGCPWRSEGMVGGPASWEGAVEKCCRGGAVTRDGTSSGAECTEEEKKEEEEQRYEAFEEKDRLAAWEEWRRAIFGRSVPFIFRPTTSD